MDSSASETAVQQAILDFTLGDFESALEKLNRVIIETPMCFDAHLAKTEVLYATEKYEEALNAAEAAQTVKQEDVHLKTSLSRIWMQLGDKEKAEKYSAEAKMLSWKEELLQSPQPGKE